LFEDDEIKDHRRVEESRGRKQPANAVTVQMVRRLREVAKRIAEEPNFSKQDYATLLVDDFGLQEGSDEYRQYMKFWRMFPKP
jgi:hypothetical protein